MSYPSSRRDFLATIGAGVLAVASNSAIALPETATGSGETQRTRKIPRTDLVVSRLAFGTGMGRIDWRGADFMAKTIPMLQLAYDQGITLFDFADTYGNGNAENAMGELLKQNPSLRDRIVLQSKCGTARDTNDEVIYNNSYEHIVAAVNGSLERLGTDRLDLYLLHFPDSLVEPEEVAKAFDEVHRAGKVRYFGVSNHSPTQIELLKKFVRQPLVVNQIHVGLSAWYAWGKPLVGHPLEAALIHGDHGAAVVDYCRVNDIQVQAWSPLTPAPNHPFLLKPGPDASPAAKNAMDVLSEIAKQHETTPAVVMLAWLLRHPAGIVPITGATKPEHLVENCTAPRIELSRQEWYALLRAVSAITT